MHSASEAGDKRSAAEAGRQPTKVLGFSKCGAAKLAGGVTGMLAGIGVAIPLGKEIDWAARIIPLGLVVVLAALAGALTASIAAGCYEREKSQEQETS